MKPQIERNQYMLKASRIILWTTIGAAILFLYFLFTNRMQPSTKIWKERFLEVIQKPFPQTEFHKHSPILYKLIASPSNVPNDEEARAVAKAYPNLPILYWLKTKKDQWKMHLTNDSCAPFPDIYRININNIYWQTIHMSNETTVEVHSAYYDTRPISGKVVRIVSMVNRTKINFPGNRTLYCQMWFENEEQPVIAPMDKLEYMWFEYWHSHGDGTLGPFLLGCSVPESHQDKIPQVVSFVENPCDKANNVLRVVYDDTQKMGEVSVCVKGLDFLQFDLSYRLIEWIELLFIFGVDKIYFYQLEAHPNIKKVLDYYVKLGKVDVREITLPNGHPNIPFIKHKFLVHNNFYQCLDEIIPYNDCFYRNLYSHDYVAILDIDEIIVPMKENNWKDLIRRVKNSEKPNLKYNGFTSQNIYFLDDMDKEIPHKEAPPYMHMLQHMYRAQNFTPPGFYVKTIFNTNETFSCHNHYPISTTGDSIDYSFRNEDARMQHYRKDCSWEVNCTEYRLNPVKDTRIWDFKETLVPRVTEAVENIGLMDSENN